MKLGVNGLMNELADKYIEKFIWISFPYFQHLGGVIGVNVKLTATSIVTGEMKRSPKIATNV